MGSRVGASVCRDDGRATPSFRRYASSLLESGLMMPVTVVRRTKMRVDVAFDRPRLPRMPGRVDCM
jgi:hypothetical protein